MTPQRKVQITIGPLLILSATLAYYMSPYFLLVPLVIGVGLTRAGLVGTCLMEKLFTKKEVQES